MQGRNKKSTSGAALLIALLLFLICAIAGSVILAASTASVGGLAGMRERQQAYYSVTSAAKFFKDEIVGKEFSYETVYETVEGSSTSLGFSEPEFEPLSNAAEYVFDKKSPYSADYTIEVDNSTSTSTYNNKIFPVKATFKMAADYTITIAVQISSEAGSNIDENTYACTLEIPARKRSYPGEPIINDDGTETEVTITEITWENAKIKKAI